MTKNDKNDQKNMTKKCQKNDSKKKKKKKERRGNKKKEWVKGEEEPTKKMFSANTKYISSRVVKISVFSLVLRTREKYRFFHRTR